MNEIKSILLVFIASCFISVNGQNITSAEYFFDTDPGIGNGVPISLSSGQSLDINFEASTALLSDGFHKLYVRFKDDSEIWSLFEGRSFYVQPELTPPVVPQIVDAEYFIDNDPGVGNGHPIDITPGSPQELIIDINNSGLGAGFHKVFIRTFDSNTKWSLYEGRSFYIQPEKPDNQPQSIVAIEYFFGDEHIPFGEGTMVNLTSASQIDETIDIDLFGMEPGQYTISIRAKDDRNVWSYVKASGFTIEESTDINSLDDNKVHIYPNPTKDFVYIECADALNGAVFKMLNVYGHILFSTVQNEQLKPIVIDMRQYPKGLYFVNIYLKDETIVKKVVVH